MSSPCTAPRDRTRLIAKAASRHGAKNESAANKLFLSSSLDDDAEGRVPYQRPAQLSPVRCTGFCRHVLWQVNKSVSRRTPGDRQTLIRLMSRHPSHRAACAFTALSKARSSVSEKYSCLVSSPATKLLRDPPCKQRIKTWERCRRLPSCQQCPSRPSWRDEPMLGQTLRSAPLRTKYRTCVAAHTPQPLRTCRRPLRSRADARRSRVVARLT